MSVSEEFRTDRVLFLIKLYEMSKIPIGNEVFQEVGSILFFNRIT